MAAESELASSVGTQGLTLNRRLSPSIAARTVFNGVVVEKSGLVFPQSVALEKWQGIGEQILAAVDSSTWWLADWLAYGETSFQDRYRETIRATSLAYQTLRNYAWVARCFELSRRRDSLSFGHHAEVAALPAPEQDYWLRKAEEHRWSRNGLRAEVRASIKHRESREAGLSHEIGQDSCEESCGHSAESVPMTNKLNLILSLTSEQFYRFTNASKVSDVPLAQWALQVLCEEAGCSSASSRRYPSSCP
jgi:hypothetical protein